MKGVVFNLLEAVVTREHGDDAWDALLDDTGLSGSYTSLGSYPDEHMMRLVASASKLLQQKPGDVLKWFGRRSMPILADRYPVFFQGHQATRTFVLSINDIIHPEVRKVYPGADVPVFDFQDDGGALLMGYRSSRKLCALAEGFIEGAADYYRETATVEHRGCMHHGDDKCLMRLSFAGAAAQ